MTRTLHLLFAGVLCIGLLALPAVSDAAHPNKGGHHHSVKVSPRCHSAIRLAENANHRLVVAKKKVTTDAKKVTKAKGVLHNAKGKAKHAKAKAHLATAKKRLRSAKKRLRLARADATRAAHLVARQGCGG